jgi:multicomponent Na+:H+ antiporter subunit F
MTGLCLGIAIYMIILIALPLYRLVKGPTVFDRVIAAGLIGVNSVLLLAVIGFGFDRLDMFIDLAIVYALLNFVGIVAAGKYLERGKNNK